MFRQLDHVRLLLAEVRQYGIQLEHENEELRKRYTALKNDYDKLKNDECKRNFEKTSQEVSNDGT